jgi:hypothetical protein
MLVFIHALDKWHSDLIGVPVLVYTDHKTPKNFDMQKDLSYQQARWMEFISQYDCKIVYIKGDKNMVADALSCTDFNLDLHATIPYSPCRETITLILSKKDGPLSCA